MPGFYTFHLIPVEDQKAELLRISEQLAAAWGGPAFEPHITLRWGSAVKEDTLLRKLHDLSTREQFSLKASNIKAGGSFTTALHIAVDEHPRLRQLSDELAECFEDEPVYMFRPHLTLLYAHIEKQTADSLASRIQLPFHQIDCDRLRLKKAFASYSTPADIEGETDIASIQLPSKKK